MCDQCGVECKSVYRLKRHIETIHKPYSEREYREVQMDNTSEMEVLYYLCCLRDVILKKEKNVSNSL